jgi:hypothetical protein
MMRNIRCRYIASCNSFRLQEFKLMYRASDEPYKGMREFCNTKNQKISIPLWTVWFCFGLAYYGLVLLIGKMFERASIRSQTCSFNTTAILLGAAAEFVGVFVASIFINPWGRMGTQAALFAGASISALLMGLDLHILPLVICSVFARSTVMGASAAMWMATPEMLATRMRTTGHAVANSMSRLGAFVAPLLVSSRTMSTAHLSILFTLLNFVAVVATFFLPETAGMPKKNFILYCH